MVKKKKPKMVFLMETKSQNIKMEQMRIQLGFDNTFVEDCVGKSGDLALLWMTEAGVEMKNFRRRHINVVVSSPMSVVPWKFTGFYGHPNASKRSEAWSLLRFLAQMEPAPWVCLGDFNEILNLSEKIGRKGRSRGLR